MSVALIKARVHELLAQVDDKVVEADGKLALAPDRDWTRAAGELSFLKLQKDELKTRMCELDQYPDDVVDSVTRWVNEDGVALMRRLEAWLAQKCG